jgi:hypothetical protein
MLLLHLTIKILTETLEKGKKHKWLKKIYKLPKNAQIQ